MPSNHFLCSLLASTKQVCFKSLWEISHGWRSEIALWQYILSRICSGHLHLEWRLCQRTWWLRSEQIPPPSWLPLLPLCSMSAKQAVSIFPRGRQREGYMTDHKQPSLLPALPQTGMPYRIGCLTPLSPTIALYLPSQQPDPNELLVCWTHFCFLDTSWSELQKHPPPPSPTATNILRKTLYYFR